MWNGWITVYKIQVEMPSGAISIGTERAEEEKALATFKSYHDQMLRWSKFTASIILSEDGVEIQRDQVINVA